MATFIEALITNPAIVASFSMPYALGNESAIFLDALKTALEEKGISAPMIQTTPNSTAELRALINGLGALQRGNRIAYKDAVAKAKASPIKKSEPSFEFPPDISPATLVHAVEQIQTLSPVSATHQMLKILQAFDRMRPSFTEADWADLLDAAQTPLEAHFLRFVRSSSLLSPLGWVGFWKKETEHPPNPTITIRAERIEIRGVDTFQYEVPLTVWPKYKHAPEDKHDYSILKHRPSGTEKFVVLRCSDGQYVARVGAPYHLQMIDAGDIFVAGGWIAATGEEVSGRNAITLLLGGYVPDALQVMIDDFYLERMIIAAKLFWRPGYRVSFPVTK